MTRLIIWRHGRTTWNAGSRFQGQADVELDDVGRRQASTAAARLAELGPNLLISSDLRRARQTADELATRTGLPVVTDARLRERHFGQWQGLTGDEVRRRFPDGYAQFRAGQPIEGCGVELAEDVGKRVTAALLDAATRAVGGTVVVTGHGGAAKYGLAALLGWPAPVLPTVAVLDNCHWLELTDHPERGWHLRAYNVG